MKTTKLKIGDKFYLKPRKEDIDNKLVIQKRELTIIGMYYKGKSANSNWENIPDMIESLDLRIQFSCDEYYTFGSPTNYEKSYKSFAKELEKDNKLLPEHRKYTN